MEADLQTSSRRGSWGGRVGREEARALFRFRHGHRGNSRCAMCRATLVILHLVAKGKRRRGDG